MTDSTTTIVETVEHTTTVERDDQHTTVIVGDDQTTIVESDVMEVDVSCSDEHVTIIDTGFGPRGPQGLPGFAEVTVAANCLSTDVVGAFVSVTGDAVSGRIQVATASPFVVSPAVGVIDSKSSPTDCTVLMQGIYTTAGGLIPNERYVLGSNGSLLRASSAAYQARPFVVQHLGQAIDSSRMMLRIETQLLRLN